MAIFNSYVILPEGIWKHLYLDLATCHIYIYSIYCIYCLLNYYWLNLEQLVSKLYVSSTSTAHSFLTVACFVTMPLNVSLLLLRPSKYLWKLVKVPSINVFKANNKPSQWPFWFGVLLIIPFLGVQFHQPTSGALGLPTGPGEERRGWRSTSVPAGVEAQCRTAGHVHKAWLSHCLIKFFWIHLYELVGIYWYDIYSIIYICAYIYIYIWLVVSTVF